MDLEAAGQSQKHLTEVFMKSKSNEFLGGAALLLTYHLYILTWIGITFLISNFKAFQAFRFTGQTVHPAHGFVLLLMATPILYFLIRRFSKRTVYRILTAHVLIAVLVPFFIEPAARVRPCGELV